MAWTTHFIIEWPDRREMGLQRRLGSGLSKMAAVFREWNISVFGNLAQRWKALLARLEGVQKAIERRGNPCLYNLENKLSEEYSITLRQGELYWLQKARSKWLSLGDRNTSYFHASTVIRRKRNSVGALQGEDGQWMFDQMSLRAISVQHYISLFKEEEGPMGRYPIAEHFAVMPEEFAKHSMLEVQADDVKKAIFKMGPYKAPGPNGFQPCFFFRISGI